MKRIAVVLVLILVFGALIWTGWYLYQKDREVPVVFETEAPAYRDILKKTVATGSVVPRKEIAVKPQVSGIITKLYVEAGQIVNKGDLIAVIEIIPDVVNLNNAENRLNRAKISLENAQKDYDRNLPLSKDGVISPAAFQQFDIALSNAREELSAAEDNLELIRKGSTKKSGKQGNTTVRATISGMVLEVPVEEGNSVIEANTFNEGTTIATIADMKQIIFEGKVDESEVGKIRTGMQLLLTIGAIEDETFDATLEYISPKGIAENGAIQFEIRAAIQLRPGQFIRAGYSANADIVLDRKDSVLSIPESLLQFDENGKPFVEVETKPQAFEKREITTGISDGVHIQISGGISEKEKVKNPNQTTL